MMEVVVCREVDRPDSSAYANAQGVPLLLVRIVPATLVCTGANAQFELSMCPSYLCYCSILLMCLASDSTHAQGVLQRLLVACADAILCPHQCWCLC